LKVSRTLADLEAKESIEPTHVSEAIQYRARDRNFLGLTGPPAILRNARVARTLVLP
jgi:hypothetical protein